MIRIEDLTISFFDQTAVSHVNLTLAPGEIVGLVGESGSGKSVTALSIMGLLSSEAVVETGKITVDDQVLLAAGMRPNEKLLRSYRGNKLSMIFQEPMTSLNPTKKIGAQVEEQLLLHQANRKLSAKERKAKVYESLASVGLNQVEEVYDSYPHQLSGGMRQRVMIAIAIILHPSLIIADEPTTALDVTIQNQIVKLLQEINAKERNSMLFITHDLNLAKRICTRVVVMKDGHIVEENETQELFSNPQTEYCRKLIAAVPSRNSGPRHGGRTILTEQEILTVKDLSAFYTVRTGMLGRKTEKQVVKNASFTIHEGETLGLVGESGCGKTSLSKAILGMNKNIKGEVHHASVRPQMIFQDPYSSLNPTKSIGWLLEEPLRAEAALSHNLHYSKQDLKEAAIDMLRVVGLDEGYYKRLPKQLSGGQRQRVSIAQALITHPKFVIADEPVSALDVTIQDQILDLMERLQEELKLSYLFISHDINVIYRVSDRIMVMKQGEILEQGERDEVFHHPQHPYTKELLEES